MDAVIGFRRGTVPFMNEPFLAKTSKQADQFVWDGNCGINLANYLPKRTGNIAIAAKGCDSRSIVIHLLENQIKREQIYVLGIPCQAMTDKRKIQEKLNGRQVLQAEDMGDRVRVSGPDFEQDFERADFLQENCACCTHKNPVIYDELLGDPIKEQEIDPYESIRKLESMLPKKNGSISTIWSNRALGVTPAATLVPPAIVQRVSLMNRSPSGWARLSIRQTPALFIS